MSELGVYKSISQVASAMASRGIAKTLRNTKQGYKFRGIDDVYQALASELVKANLVILPRIISRDCEERTSNSGGSLFYVALKVQFDFVNTEDGSTHSTIVWGEAMDSGDKATNKAMSASYKYNAIMTFCIPTEGDNDADFTTHEVVPGVVQLVDRSKELEEALSAKGKDKDKVLAFVQKKYSVDSFAELSSENVDNLLTLINRD